VNAAGRDGWAFEAAGHRHRTVFGHYVRVLAAADRDDPAVGPTPSEPPTRLHLEDKTAVSNQSTYFCAMLRGLTRGDLKMSKLTETIERIGTGVETFTADADRKIVGLEQFSKDADRKMGGLKDRIERMEALGDRPQMGRKAEPEGYRIHKGTGGDVYELESKTKMVDVLPPEKAPEIPLGRFLAAACLGEKCNDSEALAYTRELKQLTTSTSGVVIPAEYISEWIDLLRSQMVLNAAGMTTLTMDSKTQVAAAMATDPTATWHTEAGSISAGNPTFAARTLTAQTVVARCQASVEVAQDSPDFGMQLAGAMTRSIASEIDRIGLHGSGTPPEPEGLSEASSTNEVTAVGVPSDYSEMLSGVQALLESNVGLDEATAFAIMSPRTWATYEGLATGISSDNTQLPRPRALEDTQFLVTSAVSNTLATSSPSTDSAIFLGDFSDLVLGIRREASVKVLETTSYASNLLLEFVAYARCDFMLARPASFCILRGVQA
jgi:HK97 family phage major capsid protein